MNNKQDSVPDGGNDGGSELRAREMAHDVNQLLGSILGRVQLLLESDLEVPVRRHLHLVETAARDATSIVASVLGQSGSGGGGVVGPVDLSEIVATALELTESHWRSESAAPRWDVHNAVPSGLLVTAEAAVLREVFTNLIHNAIEAMPDGGGLTFSASRRGARVTLLVADEGCGMDAATAAEIFSPGFSRGKTGGHGLGLAVCRRLVRDLGGEISVMANPGVGSTFKVELPAAAEQRPVRPLRILVVDDEAQVRELVFEVLSADGHRLTLAADARQGLGAFRPGVFDLVCLDMTMPGLDGLELARAIRREDDQVVLVIMTGWGNERVAKNAEKGLVDFFAGKPLDLQAIRKLIADATDLSNRRRGLSAEA